MSADSNASWSELTAFQRDLLAAIARVENDGDDTKGTRIRDEVQEDYGVEINHGRLYPSLDELARYGFVEKGEVNKRANSYDLTAAGLSILEERRDALAEATGTPVPATDGGLDGVDRV